MSVAFIVSILYSVMNIYLFMILGYIIMSWIPSLQQSAIGNFLAAVVEPYLSIFRRIIPPIGMIDLSPIIAIFALQIAFRGLTQVLYWIF